MRRGLVTDEEFGRRVRLEKEDARLLRNAEVFLVQDCAAECKPLQVARVAVGVGAGKHTLTLREAAVKQVRPDKQFLGQFGDLVVAVLEYKQQLVELRAIHS